jgi:hypothetical protein
LDARLHTRCRLDYLRLGLRDRTALLGWIGLRLRLGSRL